MGFPVSSEWCTQLDIYISVHYAVSPFIAVYRGCAMPANGGEWWAGGGYACYPLVPYPIPWPPSFLWLSGFQQAASKIFYLHEMICIPPQRTHNVKITSLLRLNDVVTSFRRNNDVIFTSCVRWAKSRLSVLGSCTGLPLGFLPGVAETFPGVAQGVKR